MKTLKSIIALSVIVLIPFGFMLWFRNHQTTGFATNELIIYPLLFGGSSILLLYLIKKYLLNEELSDFNSGKGSIVKDILWGFLLVVMYFILFYIERATLSNILTFRSNQELLGLMLDMRKSPLLLILWFGPVLWIGIALYEELIRVFMLTSLWKFSNNTLWIISSIFITAIIIGLTHWSQGSYGIVTIAIKSLVSGYFFYKIRRILPLIIAHVLYDGIQVAMLLIIYPQ
ncbi:MAG: hypothetical protein DRJ07_15705 [Bacteroidetes bacterium]|nr:MAG: hypothetical protein DRJ07_15705 [Bacteroidota bacterium]